MEKEDIFHTVEQCGKNAMALAEDNCDDGAREWMQVKMLAEIAYQLAVMNERAPEEKESIRDRVQSHSVMSPQMYPDGICGTAKRPRWSPCRTGIN